MISRVTYVTLLVTDQDEALRFYTRVLGFEKRSDCLRINGRRWLTVAPAGQGQEIALVQVESAEGIGSVGKQVAEHSLFVLQSDDLDSDVSILSARGVVFIAPLAQGAGGRTARFVDLYGNIICLVEKLASQVSGLRSRSKKNLRRGTEAGDANNRKI